MLKVKNCKHSDSADYYVKTSSTPCNDTSHVSTTHQFALSSLGSFCTADISSTNSSVIINQCVLCTILKPLISTTHKQINVLNRIFSL